MPADEQWRDEAAAEHGTMRQFYKMQIGGGKSVKNKRPARHDRQGELLVSYMEGE